MTRNTRWHIDELPSPGMVSKHLTKQEFGRRLYGLMMSKGWNQSELARQAGLPRDSISTYIRGTSFPTPKSLQALAEVFGMPPADLLPNTIEAAIEEDVPSLEMKVSTTAPNLAWIRVNRLVSIDTATQIIALINADRAADEAANAR